MKREYEEQISHRTIWRLLYPVILLTFAQKAGSIFEGILVSIHSSRELTVTSICGPYITIITTVSYGLGIAVNVITARVSGDKVWRESGGKIAKSILRMIAVCSIILSLGSAALMFQSFQAVPELRVTGYLYILPYLLGSPVILFYSMLIAGLRGFGDTKAGMWMTFLAVPVQVILGWALYKQVGLTALGYGMLISRITACFYGAGKYKRYQPDVLEDGKSELPDHFWKEFILLAAPLCLSKVITPSGDAIINMLLLNMGTEVVAVSGLGNRLSVFFYLPAMAIGTVAVTMVARLSKGSGLKTLSKRLCLWSVCPTVVMVFLAYILAGPLWNTLTNDAAVRHAGYEYWGICLSAYPLIALEMTITSVLQALGYGFPTLIIAAVRIWGVQLPLTYAASCSGWGAKGAWIAYLVSNIASVMLSVLWGYRKVKIKIQEGNYECN